MLIDLSTIVSLELIQNLQNAKSKDCLFGVLNETLTAMGSRFLRSNILQPSTDAGKLNQRYEALGELTQKEGMFFEVRQGMPSRSNSLPYTLLILQRSKLSWTRTEFWLLLVIHFSTLAISRRMLTAIQLVVMKTGGNIQHTEQSINQILALKTFVDSIKPVWQALTGAASDELRKICQVCGDGV